MTVKVELAAIENLTLCGWYVNGTESTAVAKPSSFSFPSAAFTNVGSFLVRGSPGCYTLQAILMTASGVIYDRTNTSVSVYSSVVPPDPPVLKSAQVSNDGLSISVSFDTTTDLGLNSSIVALDGSFPSFPCTLLLTFNGVEDTMCAWLSSQRLTVTFISTPDTSTDDWAVIADTITLVPNVLQASGCVGLDKPCLFSNTSTVEIGAPVKAVVPAASLTATDTVGSCDDLTVDPTASTGTYPMKDYLNSNFRSTDAKLVIPSSILEFGEVTIELTLTNFLMEVYTLYTLYTQTLIHSYPHTLIHSYTPSGIKSAKDDHSPRQ
jgi:hypothetical protein